MINVFAGVQIIVVEPGHKLTCPKGVDYFVQPGSAINNGGGKLYCVQSDYEKLCEAAKP